MKAHCTAMTDGREELDEAYENLDRELPDSLARSLQWLRSAQGKWVRLPVGILFVAASAVWFLPVVGVEFLPLGLLLLAQDVPFLRRPTARLVMWLLQKWRSLKQWWKRRP
jgi:hypothetical protein